MTAKETVKEVLMHADREPLTELACCEVDFVYDLLCALRDGGVEAFWEVAKQRDYYENRSTPYGNDYEKVRPKLIEDAVVNLRCTVMHSRTFRKWKSEQAEDVGFSDYKGTATANQVSAAYKAQVRQARKRAEKFGISEYEKDLLADSEDDKGNGRL